MYRVVKRFLDLVLSLIGLLCAWPLLLLITIAIRLDSPGPAIFKQRRVGRGKKHFYIYKYRTMRIDTPRDMPTHLMNNTEAYVTRLGKFLRKSSLDEVPQIFNIIKGEMSIIGPRPALWNQYDLIKERDKYGVNAYRPGLTGWAQINGRDELPIPVKVEYDRYYKEHLGFILDLKIFIKTFIHVLAAKGVVEGSQAEEPMELRITDIPIQEKPVQSA